MTIDRGPGDIPPCDYLLNPNSGISEHFLPYAQRVAERVAWYACEGLTLYQRKENNLTQGLSLSLSGGITKAGRHYWQVATGRAVVQ